MDCDEDQMCFEPLGTNSRIRRSVSITTGGDLVRSITSRFQTCMLYFNKESWSDKA